MTIENLITTFLIEPIDEEEEVPVRYFPQNFRAICNQTGLSPNAMRHLYRGFKADCPSGLLDEETLRQILTKVFPSGASCTGYTHAVFSCLDPHNTGRVTFEEYASVLALLQRGSEEERWSWVFDLYDLDKKGFLGREEVEEMAVAVDQLMGEGVTRLSVLNRLDEVLLSLGLAEGGVLGREEWITRCKGVRVNRKDGPTMISLM